LATSVPGQTSFDGQETCIDEEELESDPFVSTNLEGINLDNGLESFSEVNEEAEDGTDDEIDDLYDLFRELERDGHAEGTDQEPNDIAAAPISEISYSKISKSYYYPGAAKDYGRGETFIEKFLKHPDSAQRVMSGNWFYPFSSWEEWEFSNTLARIPCSLAYKTELLNTSLVSSVHLV
jgi:hypothetical protein